MNDQLLTAGQFAKLATTTKRTVTWYDQQGILKPHHIDTNGYRLYKPEQIIDFQVILLLRQLNFSLKQIKTFLSQDDSIKSLFLKKKQDLLAELTQLRQKLTTMEQYYQTIEKEGVFIKPVVKKIPTREVYYLQKEGPYAKIYEYGLELKAYFAKLPKTTVFLTLFEELEYKPVKSRFKVAVLKTSGLHLKKGSTEVKSIQLPSYTALIYTYTGLPTLLSFHWKQLELYAKKKGLKQNQLLPFMDIEVYLHSGFIQKIPNDQVVTEMHLPITL
ncbi:MAG: MerR family transcriptional regulator [Patescibacteria group bacterium]